MVPYVADVAPYKHQIANSEKNVFELFWDAINMCVNVRNLSARVCHEYGLTFLFKWSQAV